MIKAGRYSGYLFWFIVLLFVLIALSACDNRSGNRESHHQREQLKIGRLICGGHLPLAVVEKKYQHQLKTFQLVTVQNHDWDDVIANMKSGQLAGTFILSPLAMNLIREGFPGKIILKADRNGNGFVLSKKIKSIDDLKNSKSIIAVPHIYSQHHVLLYTLMQQYGIPKDNIIVLAMPPRDMINSLRRGEIDGFMVGEPEANKSIDLGVGWMAAISPSIWKDHMDHVFLVTSQFIAEHSKQLQELVNQLVRAGRFIEKHPHEAALMGEDYTGSPAAVFEAVLKNPPDWIDYADMMPRLVDMQAMSKKLVAMGLWDRQPDDLESYIDSRFVKQAQAVSGD